LSFELLTLLFSGKNPGWHAIDGNGVQDITDCASGFSGVIQVEFNGSLVAGPGRIGNSCARISKMGSVKGL